MFCEVTPGKKNTNNTIYPFFNRKVAYLDFRLIPIDNIFSEKKYFISKSRVMPIIFVNNHRYDKPYNAV